MTQFELFLYLLAAMTETKHTWQKVEKDRSKTCSNSPQSNRNTEGRANGCAVLSTDS